METILIQIGFALIPVLAPLGTAGVKWLVALMDAELPNEVKPLVNAAIGVILSASAGLAAGPDVVSPELIAPVGLVGANLGARVRDQYNLRQDAADKKARSHH
jgi:hypothetical protein